MVQHGTTLQALVYGIFTIIGIAIVPSLQLKNGKRLMFTTQEWWSGGDLCRMGKRGFLNKASNYVNSWRGMKHRVGRWPELVLDS